MIQLQPRNFEFNSYGIRLGYHKKKTKQYLWEQILGVRKVLVSENKGAFEGTPITTGLNIQIQGGTIVHISNNLGKTCDEITKLLKPDPQLIIEAQKLLRRTKFRICMPTGRACLGGFPLKMVQDGGV